MKINAVGVTSSNLRKTVEFYGLLGFTFPDFDNEEQHVEAITKPDEVRLMIDSLELVVDILNEEPLPGNTSVFAIEFDSPDEVDRIAARVEGSGFQVFKKPWDAFWGQRYAVVEDPDGYRVDLFAANPT